MDDKCAIIKLPHHLQQKLCHTRPLYRQGKKLTSVKVANLYPILCIKLCLIINDILSYFLILL